MDAQEKKRQYNEQRAQLRREREQQGVCTQCGGFRADRDYKRCEKCREKTRASEQRRYYEHIRKQRCSHCGLDLPEGHTKQKCDRCSESDNQATRRYHQKVLASNRCISCLRETYTYNTVCQRCLRARKAKRMNIPLNPVPNRPAT